jgi:hypothetical protein
MRQLTDFVPGGGMQTNGAFTEGTLIVDPGPAGSHGST